MKLLLFIITSTFLITIQGCKSIQVIDKSRQDKTTTSLDNSENLIWIKHRAGNQCEKTIFSDLSSALFFLNGYDIVVHDSKKINFVTCSSCGCPSSLHFAVKISRADLEKVKNLGWSLYDNKKKL